MTTPSSIRVLCVDDHRIVREGIALILAREPDIEVVASAANADEAVAEFKRHRPDVTLMDLRLGERNGIDAIKEIRRDYPDARIVVLTMYQGDEDIHRALSAGAATYLLKDALSDDLIRVVRDVHAGGHPMAPDVRARIAAILGLSDDTVPVHVKNIFAKLRVNERTAAVNVGLRRGIIHIE